MQRDEIQVKCMLKLIIKFIALQADISYSVYNLFCVFIMVLNGISVHKHTKKLVNIQAS